jgi:uncharacterized protein (DUF2141 family)
MIRVHATKIAALLAAAVLVSGAASAEDVKVTLTGVKAGGEVLVALQTKDEFLMPKGAYGAKAEAKAGTMTLTLKDVKPGAYSVSVLHDQDGDNLMKRGPDGMPQEGWAMKNAAQLRGFPTWDVVSFEVGKAPVAITEAMHYPN